MVDLIIKKGELFIITLTSNLTTGYDWFIQKINPKLILLINNEFINPETTLLKVGVSGKRIMTFKALNKTNKTRITLVYKRPWEKEFIEKKVYSIKIV